MSSDEPLEEMCQGEFIELVQEGNRTGGTLFERKNIKNIRLKEFDMDRVDFKECTLYNVHITDSELSLTSFYESKILASNFSGSDMGEVEIEKGLIKNSHFIETMLGSATFKRLKVSGSVFDVSNINHAIIEDTHFEYSSFEEVGLYESLITRTYVEHCNHIMSCNTGRYTMFMYTGPEREPHIVSGCHTFSIEEAREHWSPKNRLLWSERTSQHGEIQLATLNLLETQMKARGWLTSSK